MLCVPFDVMAAYCISVFYYSTETCLKQLQNSYKSVNFLNFPTQGAEKTDLGIYFCSPVRYDKGQVILYRILRKNQFHFGDYLL